MLIVQCAEQGCLVYWSISGSEVVITLCSICWLPLVILQVFTHCWPVLGSWITLVSRSLFGFSIIDCSRHGARSISRFSINAWCLDHCFISVRHTIVSYLRLCYKLMALQCLFTEVISNDREQLWFVFCNSLVRDCSFETIFRHIYHKNKYRRPHWSRNDPQILCSWCLCHQCCTCPLLLINRQSFSVPRSFRVVSL